jgi:Ca2+-binding RTX toxin-like protein
MAIIVGTDGNDRYNDPAYPGNVELKGTNLADQMYGLAGDDELVGFDGDDLLEGGQGADVLWGQYGLDTASYQGSAAGVEVRLIDSYFAGGDAAGDRLYSIEGVRGSAFADTLYGDAQRNVLHGGGGADSLHGFEGDDTVYGEGGNDLIGGGAGSDRLDGGDGDDWMTGGDGDDVLEGGAGIDTVSFVTNYNATVAADLASGTAYGSSIGSDRLSGFENLEGSLHDDRLAGDDGANALAGRWGVDVLAGRGGADRFVYNDTFDSMPDDPDTITDFNPKQGDRIDLARIAADDQAPADTAFQFIGQGAFTDAGQVRFFKVGGDTVVEANTTDEIAGAELRIVLDPPLTLHAVDFVL